MWDANRGAAGMLCLVVGVAVWLVVRDVGVPVPAQYDYDEGVYAATADAVAHGSRLYRDVFLSQPPLFVLTIRAAFDLWGTSLAAARGAVVVLAMVWLIALLAILGARGAPWGGVLAGCLLLGRATFLRAAQTVEMEVPGEALACAAVALAAWGLRRPGQAWWAGAGVLAACAAMTKLTAVTVVIPLAAAAVWERSPASCSRWRMLVAGSVLAFGVFLPVVGNARFVNQVFTFHVVLAQKLGGSVPAHLADVGRFLAAEWPLSLAALLGGWRTVVSGAAFERALAVWLAADAVLLAELTPLWPHHLIILASPMALLAGAALRQRGPRPSDAVLAAGDGRSRPPKRTIPPGRGRWDGARAVGPGLLVACAAVYLGLGFVALVRPAGSPELERVARRIAEAVPTEGRVLTDDPMVAFLARRRAVDGLIDSSLTRIWIGEITEQHLITALHAKQTDAVVLWRGTFRQYFPRLAAAAIQVFPLAETASQGRLLLLRQNATQ